jgi:hypothetical protein
VQNVTEVYLDGKPVTGVESRNVCPVESTTYVLRTVSPSGSQDRRVTISVGAQGTTAFDFSADAYQVVAGSCTKLHWRAVGVQAVYLNNEGVAGEASRSVCPTKTTTYTLRVVSPENTSTSRSITIAVLAGSAIPMDFWADQYTLSPGECTLVHWSAEGVLEVYFGRTGREDGVEGVGSRRICPVGEESYTLRVNSTDGKSDSREIILRGEEPLMGSDEVIVHARVGDIVSTKIGEELGWNIIADGVDVLYGDGGCCQATVTLQVPQAMLDQPGAYGVPIDWPVNVGQLIEFRAVCRDNLCSINSGPPMYLRLRSQ